MLEPHRRTDGLAIGCVIVAAGALTVLTYVTSHARFFGVSGPAAFFPRWRTHDFFCGPLVGSALEFLWYNAHSAQIFIGEDVGSSSIAAESDVTVHQAEILRDLFGREKHGACWKRFPVDLTGGISSTENSSLSHVLLHPSLLERLDASDPTSPMNI